VFHTDDLPPSVWNFSQIRFDYIGKRFTFFSSSKIGTSQFVCNREKFTSLFSVFHPLRARTHYQHQSENRALFSPSQAPACFSHTLYARKRDNWGSVAGMQLLNLSIMLC